MHNKFHLKLSIQKNGLIIIQGNKILDAVIGILNQKESIINLYVVLEKNVELYLEYRYNLI